MTRDEVIRMAREAGGTEMVPYDYGERPDRFIMRHEVLERFAALVAAAERDKYEAKFKQLEALMQAREQQPNKPCCLAERKAIEPIVYGLCISDNNAQEIVDAIRKRGKG